ncbi:Uma2 family endonuclease [Streptomyces sp. NPDC059063]|uniref:Uma2 family endonuclease n=1 Tax=unclassified Streptomyces TaxID=2593676 RepID=UPI0036A7AD27
MSVVDDRIKMADENTRVLDAMFEAFEGRPILEGMRIEVVEGDVHMTPQRNVHWQIIRRVLHALDDRFGRDTLVMSDVRVDFPGFRNAFCPDVAKFRDGAQPDDEGRWQHADIEFIAEVISKGTAQNDYGPKKTTYAKAEIPLYLIADPYQRKVHVYTQPKNGGYEVESVVAFGRDVDLTDTVLGLTLKTADFPCE